MTTQDYKDAQDAARQQKAWDTRQPPHAVNLAAALYFATVLTIGTMFAFSPF